MKAFILGAMTKLTVAICASLYLYFTFQVIS